MLRSARMASVVRAMIASSSVSSSSCPDRLAYVEEQRAPLGLAPLRASSSVALRSAMATWVPSAASSASSSAVKTPSRFVQHLDDAERLPSRPTSGMQSILRVR